MFVKWKQCVIKLKFLKKQKHFITDNLVLSVSSFPFCTREEDLTNEFSRKQYGNKWLVTSLVSKEKFEFKNPAIVS